MKNHVVSIMNSLQPGEEDSLDHVDMLLAKDELAPDVLQKLLHLFFFPAENITRQTTI